MDVTERTNTLKINLLPQEVYNRIAAGEVVERPASVLKELIENSLDAGASSIEISIAGAGQKEICVSDDGEGMGKPDLLLAFERHATSKVQAVEDLKVIQTLGFRGEALSAIASVSRIEASSRLQSSLSGHRLRLHGGKIVDVEEMGTSVGTSITVKELFFNTPARKKFLKSRNVESGHLLNVFKRFALSYPGIRLSLTLEGKKVYRLPPEPLKDRIVAVFSDEMAKHLLPVELQFGKIGLSGYVGSPDLSRRTRGDQYLYVNQRWVQNRPISHAIISSYSHLLEQKKFPFYALFLDIPHEEVDVNVHPAKSEVKFRRESELYQLTHDAVTAALRNAGVDAFPSMPLSGDEKVNETTGEISPKQSGAYLPRGSSGYPQHPSQRFADQGEKASGEAYQLVFGSKDGATTISQAEEVSAISNSDAQRTQVYQFHQRFIVTEIKGGIAIIDQHAAHERVLYEKALKALSGDQLPSQRLLFPIIIKLDAENALILQNMQDDLQKLGVEVREFGERSFALEALPAGIRKGSDDSFIMELLDELNERGIKHSPGHEQVAAAFACRAAIKFGQSLSLEEMNSLIDQLFASKFPFSCPHGRPTLLQLTLGELNRRFGRV
ncbi:hypothetical protein CEE37_04120 [candidate division LCP-89 bacterium B3_LCP]|uniref:DNA mismatch repair protein MutL n=1 Tax=candidate division LCP-89 bacterium B3_LCP TaxID=2012998 RepID=A0A532V3I8_UNCL8|nr:MAG: hypothetical protein CEE37_04120 [candidate division LCP-89 bacterium B3_LCP]